MEFCNNNQILIQSCACYVDPLHIGPHLSNLQVRIFHLKTLKKIDLEGLSVKHLGENYMIGTDVIHLLINIIKNGVIL